MDRFPPICCLPFDRIWVRHSGIAMAQTGWELDLSIQFSICGVVNSSVHAGDILSISVNGLMNGTNEIRGPGFGMCVMLECRTKYDQKVNNELVPIL